MPTLKRPLMNPLAISSSIIGLASFIAIANPRPSTDVPVEVDEDLATTIPIRLPKRLPKVLFVHIYQRN